MQDKQIRDEIELSPRLKAIADFVLPGRPMADIGSDHAYLPLFLVKNQLIPYAIGVEIHPGPWERASRQVRLHDLEDKIQIRLGDGLEPIKAGEISTAVLAGMGSQTIMGILSRAGDTFPSLERIVLQPMAEIPLLRQWIYQQGWHLVDEELVVEGERFYTIMAAEPGMEPSMPGKREMTIGPLLLHKKHPLLKPYIARLLEKKRRVLAILADRTGTRVLEQQQQLVKEISDIEEVMECLLHVKK